MTLLQLGRMMAIYDFGRYVNVLYSALNLCGVSFATILTLSCFLQASTGDRASDRKLDAIGKIPLPGYINDVAIGPKARFCIAAVGQEPKLGRWDRIPRSKNRFAIISLRHEDEELAEENNEEGEEEEEEGSTSEEEESSFEEK